MNWIVSSVFIFLIQIIFDNNKEASNHLTGWRNLKSLGWGFPFVATTLGCLFGLLTAD